MTKLKEVWWTLRVVYKNMTWNRPKVGLYGLVVVALLSTLNLYFNALKFGQVTADFLTFLSLGAWFFVMPCVFTLIDLHKNPKRMENLWAVLQGDVRR